MTPHDRLLPKRDDPFFVTVLLAASLTLAACGPVPGTEESGDVADPIVATSQPVDEAGQATTDLATEAPESDVDELVDASGDELRPLYARLETFPGSTRLEDLDEDGRPEILLDETDGYVFCRACGVAEANFRFLGWNEAAGEFMPLAGPEHSMAVPASERGPLSKR